MTAPQRIQRKRTRGWRMPPNTVYVGRPTKWGNIIAVPDDNQKSVELFEQWLNGDITPRLFTNLWFAGVLAVGSPGGVSLRQYYESRRQRILDDLHELRGKNLADWCSLNEPCHADVLLKLANRD